MQGLVGAATLLPSQTRAMAMAVGIARRTAGYSEVRRSVQAWQCLHYKTLHSLDMLHEIVASFPRTCQVPERGRKVIH